MTIPSKIDENVRHAMLNALYDLAGLHPDHATEAAAAKCPICRHIREGFECLDAEQREHGPPIDVTDPSYLRMTVAERTRS